MIIILLHFTNFFLKRTKIKYDYIWGSSGGTSGERIVPLTTEKHKPSLVRCISRERVSLVDLFCPSGGGGGFPELSPPGLGSVCPPISGINYCSSKYSYNNKQMLKMLPMNSLGSEMVTKMSLWSNDHCIT